MKVCLSVGPLLCPSVCLLGLLKNRSLPSVCAYVWMSIHPFNTSLIFFYICHLWPHCSCPNALLTQTLPLPTPRDWGSRVSGRVFFQFLLFCFWFWFFFFWFFFVFFLFFISFFLFSYSFSFFCFPFLFVFFFHLLTSSSHSSSLEDGFVNKRFIPPSICFVPLSCAAIQKLWNLWWWFLVWWQQTTIQWHGINWIWKLLNPWRRFFVVTILQLCNI